METKEVSNKRLIYKDETPDHLGRRFFFLEWDDPYAYRPDLPKEVIPHRGQTYFDVPDKYILEGFIPS